MNSTLYFSLMAVGMFVIAYIMKDQFSVIMGVQFICTAAIIHHIKKNKSNGSNV